MLKPKDIIVAPTLVGNLTKSFQAAAPPVYLYVLMIACWYHLDVGLVMSDYLLSLVWGSDEDLRAED